MTRGATRGEILAISGGIGGAKLALGLYRVLPPGELIVVANTGDDFEHLGLTICPDLDTLLYTLAGLADSSRGWGRAEESWAFMSALAELGSETWFQLGDRDLAVHVERTRRLREGRTLSTVMETLRARFRVHAALVPMSDSPVRTMIRTDDGELAFQDYFVREACRPRVREFRFHGAESAEPSPRFRQALTSRTLRAIVICPSNPFISIDPVLAIPGVRDALIASLAPVVAVSPIIGGEAVKGPTAKMLAELGEPVSAAAVARHYAGLLDGFVMDEADAGETSAISMPVLRTSVLMRDLADRERLAREVLGFADELGRRGR